MPFSVTLIPPPIGVNEPSRNRTLNSRVKPTLDHQGQKWIKPPKIAYELA